MYHYDRKAKDQEKREKEEQEQKEHDERQRILRILEDHGVSETVAHHASRRASL